MAVVERGRASGALADADGALAEGGVRRSAGHSTVPLPQAYVQEAPSPAVAFAPVMRTLTRLLSIQTERHLEFVDLTDHVVELVAEAGVRDGFAVVFSRHTTAGIRINEHEPMLLEDMAQLLERIVPCGNYRHDDFSVRTVNLTENERINGHSHCRSLLLGASETVPVAAGRLLLGRWQRVFLVELDGPQQREIDVQVMGA
jgi:secondary thiamine-phosphate synthase enzyme